MTRTKKSKPAKTESAATKPAKGNETFNLAEAFKAEPPAAAKADLPTKYITPEEFIVEDDSRIVPAANQAEIDRDRAVDIFIRGQKQPAVVYPGDVDDRLIGVTGHTRARAVKLIREGFDAIDPRTGEATHFHDPNRLLWVAVDRSKTKEDAFVDGLATNIKSSGLTTVQEAYAVKRLTERHGWTLTEAARFFGYNNTNRQNKLLKLLDLEQEVIEKVNAGELSLDAAVSTADLKPAARLKLLNTATGDDGKVDPVKLRQQLRDVYSKGDEEVKQNLDQQFFFTAAEADAKAAAEASKPAARGKGGKGGADDSDDDEDEGDGKPAAIKRNVADLKRFVQEQVKGDEAVPQPVVAFFEKLEQWFAGKVGDRSLWNTIDEAFKQK